MEAVKTPQQLAAEAAQAAAVAARAASDAALTEVLESIVHIRDFGTKTRTKFEADKLKSQYISRYGFERFQTLCGQSR